MTVCIKSHAVAPAAKIPRMAKFNLNVPRQERRTRNSVAIFAAAVFVVDLLLPSSVGVVLLAPRSSSERLVIGAAAACSAAERLTLAQPTHQGTVWK